MAHRANKQLTLLRVEAVVTLRLKGIPGWKVCQIVTMEAKEPGSIWTTKENKEPVSKRQIERYVSKADRVIERSVCRQRRKMVRQQMARREFLYEKAVNDGDVKTALDILRDESKLAGLYPVKKVALTDPTGKKPCSIELKPDDRVAALQRLYATLGSRVGGSTADGNSDTNGHILGEPNSPDV